MKVAIIHDWLNGMRGGEKVLEILCDIFPDAPIFTLFYEPDQISEKIRNRKIIHSYLQKFPNSRKFYRYLLPFYKKAIESFDLSGYDLIISISHCAAKSVRIPKGCTHICYCLSPIRYIWDKYDDYFANKSPFSPVRIMMALMRKRLQLWDSESAAGVDFFITSSEYIAKRIQRCYKRDSKVIAPPVDTKFFNPGDSIPPPPGNEDYYLIVSALVPYKRVGIAVEAFKNRKEKLIIAGSGPEEVHLKRNAPDNVIFKGWIEDSEILDLYRKCKALIFTPEEDFGIVPLEAMSCGKPVIAFGSGGALETVVENKTGVFFMEQTSKSLSEILDKFDPDEFDPIEIRKHAKKYSKENFVKKMKQYIQEKA
jgi:glycosyltransferase involved in cell wall biosynthesis